ncbi:hypothetical protein SAMN02799636_06056 [Methylobacterium sp. 275MFSha3.1]|nr:hypothetical protein SAMN02799636_06056 [Methylobacterium sp. 275MFSha3.1]
MRSGYLTKELSPHLARPHKPRAEPIDPEPKRLVKGSDREADMISATHVDACVFRHEG